jgi:hypothetical protein
MATSGNLSGSSATRLWMRACRAAARTAAVGVAVLTMIVLVRTAARADGPQAVASELSDRAFSMLNSINAAPAGAGPLLGPVANLASDAQTLSAALGRDDRVTAGRAMAAVQSDRSAVEEMLRKGNRLPDPGQWKVIEGQIAALTRSVHPIAGAMATGVPPESTPSTAAKLPPEAPPAPRVVIESRVFSDGAVRVRGYMQGTDLKSAGIFNDDQLVKPLEFGSASGPERVRFDLSIEAPTASESIRVTDALDRIGRAPVAPDVAALPNTRAGGEKVIELGGGVGSDSVASAGPGLPPAMPGPRNNTAEIPPANTLDKSEGGTGRRLPGGAGGNLTGVQINVIFADEAMDQPGNYHVVGQISGSGVRRAGVYVGGRMVRPIAISPGSYSAFDVTFPLLAGKEATIRAYGAGSNYVEASVDGSDSGATVMRGPGMYPPNPYAYGNPYARPNPYGAPAYGAPPYGSPPYGYGYPPSPYGYPAPAAPKPWYRRLFP